MDFLRKHGALLAFGIILTLGAYTAGRHSVPLAAAPVNLENRIDGQPTTVDFSPFWKAWNVLQEKYIPASTTAEKVDDQDKVWGSIEGLAKSLGDPYTTFFPPTENKIFESDIRGNFEGVGMEVSTVNSIVTVIAPLKGSPAERAGIIAGDKIIKIDGKDALSLSTDEAVNLIRGPKGSTVTFTIIRTGRKDPLEIKIVRDVINIPTINTKDLGNGIFDIELYSFSENSPNLFRGALREFIQSGDTKLILDLRGNPGGYLEAAIDMASWFLESGKVVVRENFSGQAEEKVYRSKGYDIFNDKLKFVILVDEGSASASEILAGALSEQGKATLVGTKTFGKGSVQELVPITTDTSLKVTVARWLTPNGKSISSIGITPDISVARSTADKEAGRDPQLDAAVKYLTNN